MHQHHVTPDRSQDLATYPLPTPLTCFIGREREIAEVKQLLTSSRLVTLTGAGGCGKTRLALQVASDLRPTYADGVCWVDLAPLADASLLPQVLAKALNITEQAGRAPSDTILDLLHVKCLLLVLDNCEHLASACAEFAHDALCEAPQVSILATSREPLAVMGEMLYPVAPLAVPPKSQTTDVAPFDSIRLFVDRARDILPSFKLTSTNTETVADICRRLDGIPLAIELASARVNTLTVEQIAARLDDRFALLTSARHGVPSHHRTLRAALDWSYDSLSTLEQTLLQRLSVFAGTCSLESAEQVCAGTGIAPEQIVDALSALVNKSLVIAETLQSSEARYRMLETIRQYARDKLLQAGGVENLHHRHLDYFAKFAQSAALHLHGPEQLAWLDRLEQEHDNVRIALEWSLGSAHVHQGLELVVALLWFWDLRTYTIEGRVWAERFLKQREIAADPRHRADALLVAGIMTCRSQGDARIGCQYLEEMVEIARELGQAGQLLLSLGLGYLSYFAYTDDRARAEKRLAEGMAAARASGDQWNVAKLLWLESQFLSGKRDYTAALESSQASERIFRALGDQLAAARSSLETASLRFKQNDYAAARRQFERLLPFFRSVKDRFNIGFVLVLLGEIERTEGRYDLARKYYLDGLALGRELGLNVMIAVFAGNLGCVLLHEGRVDEAMPLFEECLTLGQKSNYQVAVSLALFGLAGVRLARQQARCAVTLLAVSRKFIDVRNETPADRVEYERYLALARKQLDDATFNAAWKDGEQMSLAQAIAQAAQELAPPPPTLAPASSRDPNALTPREMDVLRLVAAGMSDAQIAAKLVISRRTVNTHLTAIYGKLGVNSRSAATRCALDRKLV